MQNRVSLTAGKKKALTTAVLILILLLLPLVVTSTFYIHIFILAFIFIIATCSLRLLAVSGQISMGHAGFMSIGAYTSAVLAKTAGLSPWLTMIIGGLATMVVGYLIGFPFARLRGIYYTMITLFFGIAVLSINQLLDNYTGGYSGLAAIPPLFATGNKIIYYYFFLVLGVVCLAIMYRLENSRIGLTWKAIAQSYSVASSIGINEVHQKAIVLAVSGFFVGIAGAGYAHYYLLLSHDTFGFLASLNIMVYMLVGGIGNFAGPIIGTAILVIIPEAFRSLKDYVPYVFSAIMLFMLLVTPRGLAGLPDQFRKWRARSREKKGIAIREEVN